MTKDGIPSRFAVDFTGLTLLGVYRVEKRLADGGMATIYLAEDTNLGRPVVVKVPHPRFLGEPGFRRRFIQEIGELVRLEHPHIARILARGEHEELPFFVLQYLGGGSLEDRLEEEVSLPDLADWLGKVADTLDFVHERGVVHRDVKPGNILFDEAGHVFLSDFGVAKALDAGGAGITGTGTTIGSPLYMAPEQGIGDEVGPAADQYALATVVYHALAGRAPFEGDRILEVLMRKTREPPPDLRAAAPGVPEGAAAAVMRAISRKPGRRFPTCRAFADHFREGLAAAGVALRGGTTPVSLPAPTPPRRAGVLALGVLALAVLAAGLLLLRPWESSAPPPGGNSGDGLLSKNVWSEVILLTPGAEPRRLLRYRIAAGDHETVRTRLDLVNEVFVSGELFPSPAFPPVVHTSTLDIAAVAPEGASLRWEMLSCERAEPPPEGGAAQPELQMMQDLVGVVARGVVDQRGRLRDVSYEVPEGEEADPGGRLEQLAAGLDQIVVPLPDEPVGLGAKWERSQAMSSMGMRVTYTVIFELVEREGDRLRLKMSLAITAPAQELVPGEGLPVQIRLNSFNARSQGEAAVDLRHLAPRKLSTPAVMESTGEILLTEKWLPYEQKVKIHSELEAD